MSSSHSIFNKTNNEERAQINQNLRLIGNTCLASLSHWIKLKPGRLELLQAAMSDSFNPDASSYSGLPASIKNILEDHKKAIPTLNEKITRDDIKEAISDAINTLIDKTPTEEPVHTNTSLKQLTLDLSNKTNLVNTIANLPPEDFSTLNEAVESVKFNINNNGKRLKI